MSSEALTVKQLVSDFIKTLPAITVLTAMAVSAISLTFDTAVDNRIAVKVPEVAEVVQLTTQINFLRLELTDGIEDNADDIDDVKKSVARVEDKMGDIYLILQQRYKPTER